MSICHIVYVSLWTGTLVVAVVLVSLFLGFLFVFLFEGGRCLLSFLLLFFAFFSSFFFCFFLFFCFLFAACFGFGFKKIMLPLISKRFV